MTPSLITAIVRLADVLQTENAALAALNMPAAARLLPEKLAAANALAAARADASDKTQVSREMEAVAHRLRGLAAENRRLLERAMLVQGRVIATVAKAARMTAERETPSYGARGAARLAAYAVLRQA